MDTKNKPDSKEYSVKKHRIISENLDRITDDLLVMFEEIHQIKMMNSDIALFRNKSKSVLYYWLSQVYDEAHSDVKNLETALDTSKSIVKKLRDSEQNLKAVISSSSPPELNHSLFQENKHDTIKTPALSQKDLDSKIDGFYSSLVDRVIQDFNKTPKK